MTNNAKSEQIFDLIIDRTGIPPQRFDSNDIFLGNGMDGDDAFEFMEAFSTRFGVNLDDYRWYFHHGEEGFGSLGGVFFPPPYARVTNIPITMEDLVRSANSGRWTIEYPPHQLPESRADIKFDQGCTVILVLVFLAFALKFATD